MGIVIAILGLGLVIFVHELGHFTMGKIFKLQITEFFIGLPFGKAILKFKRGETEYGIKPVLFGGYVKFPEFMTLSQTEIEKIKDLSPAAEIGLKKGDKIVRIDDREMKDWLQIHDTLNDKAGKTVEMTILRRGLEEVMLVTLGSKKGVGELGAGPAATDDITIEDLPATLEGQSLWKKGLVMSAGPAMNVITAIVLVVGTLMIGFDEPTTTIGRVVAGGPAAKVGMKAGDEIISIAGKNIANWESIIKTINKNAGSEVLIEINRDGKELKFYPRLRKKSKEGRLGVVTKLVRRPRGPVTALKDGLGFIYQSTVMIFDLLAKLATNPKMVVGQLRGPIGVVSETAPIVQRNILEYLITLAGINMAIGIFNFLPIPPLDGGRIFISGIEFIIRRPIPKESLIFVNVIGISLLLVMMTYVIAADIFRLAVPGGG